MGRSIRDRYDAPGFQLLEPPGLEAEKDLGDQMCASWNHVAGWLRLLDVLRVSA